VRFVDYIVGAVAVWNGPAKTLSFRRYRDEEATIPQRWYTGPVEDYPGNESDRHDFLDVALHEVGHIIGLDHTSDEDDVMTDGPITRTNLRVLSGDDILGARDLYTIPIPEPSTFALLRIVLAIFVCCDVRRSKRQMDQRRDMSQLDAAPQE
jgi:matrixin